jgi:CCR4-NOT transcription complex subunit 2
MLRIWLTKESGTAPSLKLPGGEQGVLTFWDPDNWNKERMEMILLYADLEEKILMAPPTVTFTPGSVQQQQQVTHVSPRPTAKKNLAPASGRLDRGRGRGKGKRGNPRAAS